jgi:hypothetical protein
LGIGGQDLGHGFFKLTASLDPALNFLDPLGGDALHAFLASGHEGERPNGVALRIVSAMAGGLTTAAVSERKRTREQIRGDGEAAEKFELALAESSGLGAFGGDLHMSVMIHTELAKSSDHLGMRK